MNGIIKIPTELQRTAPLERHEMEGALHHLTVVMAGAQYSLASGCLDDQGMPPGIEGLMMLELEGMGAVKIFDIDTLEDMHEVLCVLMPMLQKTIREEHAKNNAAMSKSLGKDFKFPGTPEPFSPLTLDEVNTGVHIITTLLADAHHCLLSGCRGEDEELITLPTAIEWAINDNQKDWLSVGDEESARDVAGLLYRALVTVTNTDAGATKEEQP